MHSQGLRSWLHRHHFPCDAVSTHISMPGHRVLTWTCSDVKHIIRNLWKMVWAVTLHLLDVLLRYKNPCNSYPCAFFGSLAALYKRSLQKLDPRLVPGTLTFNFNKCAWVILPLHCCLPVHLLVGFSVTYIQYTKSCTRRQDPQPSSEANGVCPIRKSILQHREATEATVITLYWLMLTSRPYRFCDHCPQPLHIFYSHFLTAIQGPFSGVILWSFFVQIILLRILTVRKGLFICNWKQCNRKERLLVFYHLLEYFVALLRKVRATSSLAQWSYLSITRLIFVFSVLSW